MNAITDIVLYRTSCGWSFDDSTVGLIAEPFVAGMPEIIDTLAGNANRITLRFSAAFFPGYKAKLVWLREEGGGNWYRLDGTAMEGWLCSALYKYFETAPDEIYIAVFKENKCEA